MDKRSLDEIIQDGARKAIEKIRSRPILDADPAGRRGRKESLRSGSPGTTSEDELQGTTGSPRRLP